MYYDVVVVSLSLPPTLPPSKFYGIPFSCLSANYTLVLLCFSLFLHVLIYLFFFNSCFIGTMVWSKKKKDVFFEYYYSLVIRKNVKFYRTRE